MRLMGLRFPRGDRNLALPHIEKLGGGGMGVVYKTIYAVLRWIKVKVSTEKHVSKPYQPGSLVGFLFPKFLHCH